MGKIIVTTEEELTSLIQTAITNALTGSSKEKPEPYKDTFLTIQEASELLKVAVQTIYGYVHNRTIPVYKRGKRLYFSKVELIEWVKAGRIKTGFEIEREAEEYMIRERK